MSGAEDGAEDAAAGHTERDSPGFVSEFPATVEASPTAAEWWRSCRPQRDAWRLAIVDGRPFPGREVLVTYCT